MIVFVLLAAGGVYLSWYLKRKRRQELLVMARQLGLEFSPLDTVGLLGMPFALLQKGDGRGTENLLSGTWQGMAVTEFDYWYYEESTDSKGGRTRTYYRFSCAVAEIPATCPQLTIARENLFSRMADHLGFSDINFESEEFNRAFNVKAKDRKFANDLIDPRMMQWLLREGGDFGYEVALRWVLCYSKKRRPTELVPLLGSLKGFGDHMPRVFWELYGVQAAQ